MSATTIWSIPIGRSRSPTTRSPTEASVSPVRFSGSFLAPQQAQSTLSVHTTVPRCTSQAVAWSASTPTPPPTPPQRTISSRPSGKTGSRKATFRFRSGEAGSTFQCELDAKPWGGCKSPKKYSGLANGKHTFRVKARDSAGNVDPSAAKRSWRLDAG
ncbi:MAG: hypothetical protein U0R26_00710 [Solirubrobacterales bacterium]